MRTLMSAFLRTDLTLSPDDVLYLVERAEAFGLGTSMADKLRKIAEAAKTSKTFVELYTAVGISSAQFSAFRMKCRLFVERYLVNESFENDPVGFKAKFALCPGNKLTDKIRQALPVQPPPKRYVISRSDWSFPYGYQRKVVRTVTGRDAARAFLAGFKYGQRNPKIKLQADEE